MEMFNRSNAESNQQRFQAARRKTVRVSSQQLVRFEQLAANQTWPLVLRPNVEGLNPVTWARESRQQVDGLLLQHGAILFRDFNVDSAPVFERFIRALSPELLDYQERAAPRQKVIDNVYTSTEFPSDQRIPLHHEMSYSHNWPTKIWFYCAQPAQQGGQTPIADDRRVFNLIDPKIKERFIEKRVMYVRNYGQGVDLSWSDAFQTTDRSTVEGYFRRAGIEFEWRANGGLRTRQIRQAVVAHPKTGETIWFNHAHMFHYSNLAPAVRDSLLAEFGEEELPRNAYYGDGSPIEASVLEEIRRIYRESAVSFQWQQGDVLMLDNFLTSHGREPFVGPRTILVGMAEMFVNRENAS